MGLDAATEALRWGVNDLGGTLMEESICRMAGSYHGVRLDPPDLIAAAHRAGRPAAERTTLYELRAHHPVARRGVRTGIFVAPFGELADVRVLAQVAADAEAAGWDGFFVWDHVQTHGSLDVADPWIALTAVALATERVRARRAGDAAARRRPWDLARQIAVSTALSGGRMVLGAGLVGDGRREFSAFGEERDPKLARRCSTRRSSSSLELWHRCSPSTTTAPPSGSTRRRGAARRPCSSRARPCGCALPLPEPGARCGAPRATTACSRSPTTGRSAAPRCARSSRSSPSTAPPAPAPSTWSSPTTPRRTPIGPPSSPPRAPPGGFRASAIAPRWRTCDAAAGVDRHNGRDD